MASLLEQAIVDAKTLREAALKNAEDAVINKYSDEVKTALEQLLEQDELGLETEGSETAEDQIEEDVEEVPYAATDGLSEMEGENLDSLAGEGDDVEINLDLGALREAIESLGDEEVELEEEKHADDEEEEKDLSEEVGTEEELYRLSEEEPVDAEEDFNKMFDLDELEEGEEEFSEELIDSIVEKLTVDMGASLSGWAGRSAEDKKHQMELELAGRRSTEMEEELKDLKTAQEELVFENKNLIEQIEQYRQATMGLKETLQDVNLSNARLLYTNRVLRNTSLNERQKERIVEAISKADSAAEAKTIYNTLESTVEAKPKRRPQSLSEAISRPSSVLRATRKEEQPVDSFAERMKKLAGID